MQENCETYQWCPAKGKNNGVFFFTDCGNRMYYAFNNPEKYHGCLCPKCHRTLYVRGSEEARKFVSEPKRNNLDK